MLEEMLRSRELPPLKSREEMIEILCREEYGDLPDVPFTMAVSEPVMEEYRFPPRGVNLTRVDMTIRTEYGAHTFPVHQLLHHDSGPHPFIIYMDFSRQCPSKYYPIEMAAERGFNVLSFCYEEATLDKDEFDSGVAKILLPHGRETGRTCGKIGLWAFCAMRVMDYALTLPCNDPAQGAILGHSRLGKTALYTGMLDTRFRYSISNSAGCAGDSLVRGGLAVRGVTGKHGDPGESVERITTKYGYWFCTNYARHGKTNIPEGFDQHYLLATIAPRYVEIGSSDDDDWADPDSQQLCCLAAGKMWEERYGLPGLVHHDRILEPGEELLAGRVGYHRRAGQHFLSWHDWKAYMDFTDLHRWESVPETK